MLTAELTRSLAKQLYDARKSRTQLRGNDIPFERFIAPRVEVELAFVLARPLKGRRAALLRVE